MQPEDPGSLAHKRYSALHNKSQKSCATHKMAMKFRQNTEKSGDLRNGCLTFWQLPTPTLIPELVQLPQIDKNYLRARP
jgi:hypothetical protein